VTPYYADDLVTIYHGDCRDTSLWQPPVFALVTDPPYGINAQSNGFGRGRKALTRQRRHARIIGDCEPFDPAPWLDFPQIVLFGANHYAHRLPPSSRWLIWDKRDGLTANALSDCELAWTNLKGPARLFSHRWFGMLRDSERGEAFHPTQKPVALMRWVLAFTTGSVLDPYMGAGSTLVAAKSLDRRAIGIEIEERYCEIAARRCSQEVLGLGDAA
jgi:site-specific DNA-methyltransferase (adenine-specific)